MEHGQRIKIDDSVITNNGGRAKLEIDAPESVKIDRQYKYAPSEAGQQVTVEQQRKMALAKFNRGNRK